MLPQAGARLFTAVAQHKHFRAGGEKRRRRVVAHLLKLLDLWTETLEGTAGLVKAMEACFNTSADLISAPTEALTTSPLCLLLLFSSKLSDCDQIGEST